MPNCNAPKQETGRETQGGRVEEAGREEQGGRVAHPCANYCAPGGARPVLRKGEQYQPERQPTPESTGEQTIGNPLCPLWAMPRPEYRKKPKQD